MGKSFSLKQKKTQILSPEISGPAVWALMRGPWGLSLTSLMDDRAMLPPGYIATLTSIDILEQQSKFKCRLATSSK